MRIADLIFKCLEGKVSCIYMVPGGGSMYLVDALGLSSIRYVSAIHEQGAGFMAIGHAMAIDDLGVCLVTSGPGSTNVLTATAAAWVDSIPILFISGQAKSSSLVGSSQMRSRGVQEIDIIPIVKPITKIAWQLEESYLDIPDIMDSLVYSCLSERRGPCWLSIPLDLQGMELP
jgi:acetolactate synthase-1/2/3 large subunit